MWNPVGIDNATGRGTPFVGLLTLLEKALNSRLFHLPPFLRRVGDSIGNRETGSRSFRGKHLRKGSADMNGLVPPKGH